MAASAEENSRPGPSDHGSLLRRIARKMRRRPATVNPVLDDVAVIAASQRFDRQWYLDSYADVAISGMDPIEHYVRHGAAEGRDPCAEFDSWFYLGENPDVAHAGLNPFRHYIETGLAEGRPGVPAARRKITEGPLVSIIIPVYAVEEYLPECLESVVNQTYRNLEIIIVDDGSPDQSHEIAAAYAETDSRIKILRRENNGLGAARNAGVAAARGDYLTFVDSDDTLPPDAIAKMVSSVQRTGSDFVVGSIRRLRNGKVMPADGWVKEVHAEDRTRVRLEDFPKILTDVFVCNKLFDSVFFRREVGAFPEKVRYEDQEPTARAYLHGVFDVLAGTVYHWRIREDGTSITQKKSDLEDLHDRLTVKLSVSRILAGTEVSTYETWLAKAIGFDLRPYFEQVPRTRPDFFDRLHEGMLPLAEQMTPRIWKKVRMIDRLPALAVLAGHRDDVCTAVTRRAEYGFFVPGRLNGGAAYLDRKYLEGMKLSLDDELLELADDDLSVVACATSLGWRDGRLHLEGYAYLTNLDFGDDARIAARLVSDNRPPIELSVRQRHCPRIDHETRDAWNTHAGSGFATDIDPTELGLDTGTTWRIEVAVTCPGLNGSRSAVLREADLRSIQDAPAVSAIRRQSRWTAGFEEGAGFVLRCSSSAGALVAAIDTKGGKVTITTEHSGAESLLLVCETLHSQVEVAGTRVGSERTVFRFELPDVDDGDNREHLWHMHVCGGGDPQKLAYPGERDDLAQASPEHHRIRAVMGPGGSLRLAQNSWWAVADEVEVAPGSMIVRGRVDAPGAMDLSARLVGETQVLEADGVEFDPVSQRFEVRVPFDPAVSTVEQKAVSRDGSQPSNATDERLPAFAVSPSGRQELFQPTLLHGFSMRLSIAFNGKRRERWLRVATGLQDLLPADRAASRYGLTLTRTSGSAALWLQFRPPYAEDERGRLAQHRLHASIRHSLPAMNGVGSELQNAVLFESFGGRQISDSVLAICEEIVRRRLGLDLYWTVTDLSLPVPKDTRPLLINSRDWMYQLHHARYLVNNNNFPFYFRKNAGQIYLQTWHGTPLKRIGNDVPSSNLSLPYRQLMQREASYWDFLLAQNDYAAEILPKAFDYAGRVLNLGYPRNDALIGAPARLRRVSARNRFGFEPYHFVVLYAPTWRDNLSAARGYSRVNYLDFKSVRKALGSNVRLVVRGHHNTARSSAINQAGVIDATHHPDINDLLLAADLLITDYSSVMFDYVVTGKPVVFLTPDLDEYRDRTRGFYLDLEAIAPGSVCRTNDELVDVLSHLGEAAEAYLDRYREFIGRFAPRDDGTAARRVVDAFLGSGAAVDRA
jgi:CDP-glycerol glycerophosphotransferase